MASQTSPTPMLRQVQVENTEGATPPPPWHQCFSCPHDHDIPWHIRSRGLACSLSPTCPPGYTSTHILPTLWPTPSRQELCSSVPTCIPLNHSPGIMKLHYFQELSTPLLLPNACQLLLTLSLKGGNLSPWCRPRFLASLGGGRPSKNFSRSTSRVPAFGRGEISHCLKCRHLM